MKKGKGSQLKLSNAHKNVHFIKECFCDLIQGSLEAVFFHREIVVELFLVSIFNSHCGCSVRDNGTMTRTNRRGATLVAR